MDSLPCDECGQAAWGNLCGYCYKRKRRDDVRKYDEDQEWKEDHPTRDEIFSDINLWWEYLDPQRLTSEEEFSQMSFEEKQEVWLSA